MARRSPFTFTMYEATIPYEPSSGVEKPKNVKSGSALIFSSAIVVPQTVSAGSQFIKIALGEDIRYYTLPTDKVLKSGYAHNYKLIVKERKVEVKTESEIGDWVGDDNAGDAEEDN